MPGKRKRKRDHGAAVFAAGAPVEVRWDEDGFFTAWYEATVARARPNGRGYDVVYASLVTDHDPTCPLRETVRASHIRPQAPRLNVDARFELDQLVDAFHNDGWWAGVVSAVVDGGCRYTVCFPASREVLEFGGLEMRPHLEWRFGEWCPPEEQVGGKAIFGAGEQIEVSADKDNYGAVWYPGTILKVIAKTILLVEYKKPREDGCHDLLREIVYAQCIRPTTLCRPEGKPFIVLDEIEVHHCGGWMPGVVLKIVDNSKYVVKLKYGKKEEIEIPHSEMRVLRTWVNGQWIRLSKRRGRPSVAGKTPDLPISVSPSSSSDMEELHETILKCKMREGPSCEGHSEAIQPSKDPNKGDSLFQSSMDIDLKTPALEPEVRVAMQDFESPPSELIVRVPRVRGLQKNLSFDEQMLPKCTSTSELVVTGRKSSNSEGVKFDQLSKTHNVHGPRMNGLKQRKMLVTRQRKPQEVPYVINVRLLSEEDTKKRPGTPSNKSTEEIVDMNVTCLELRQPEVTTDVVIESKEGIEGVDLSKRGVLDDVPNGIRPLSHRDEALVCENSLKPVDVEDTIDSSPQTNEIGTEVEIKVRVPPLMEGSAAARSVKEPSTFDPQTNEIGPEVEIRMRVPPLMEGSAAARSVKEPSSFDHLRLDVAGSEAESMVHQLECNSVTNVSQSQRVNVEETALKTLPFVKSSPLWESIESMEVFHMMPQQPHFRQLEQYCMEFREGMAIGLMVTFANLVTNVKKLCISDSHSTFEERLKALVLVPFEENGFDVQRLRSRIHELLEIRNNRSQFENKKAALDKQIFEREIDKVRLDTLKVALDKTVMEVEQQLAHIRERRDSVVAQGIDKGSEIASLQENVKATKEAYLFAEQHFDSILSSPSLW